MKVIKVGTYRIFFLIASLAGLVFFGITMNGVVFSITFGVLFGWVIFEINLVLQSVIIVQRMLAHLMQPAGAKKEQTKGEIDGRIEQEPSPLREMSRKEYTKLIAQKNIEDPNQQKDIE